MQLPLGHHLPRGGASSAARRRSMQVLVSHAIPIGQPSRVRCPIGRHRGEGEPGGAPRGAGELWLARRGLDTAAIDGPLVLGAAYASTPTAYFAFCVPDGVKGASSWLGAVSHIFGRWDSRKRGGAVINARPPRPRLRTVGNFMMVLLTSHKVFSSGLLY